MYLGGQVLCHSNSHLSSPSCVTSTLPSAFLFVAHKRVFPSDSDNLQHHLLSVSCSDLINTPLPPELTAVCLFQSRE